MTLLVFLQILNDMHNNVAVFFPVTKKKVSDMFILKVKLKRTYLFSESKDEVQDSEDREEEDGNPQLLPVSSVHDCHNVQWPCKPVLYTG